MDVKIKRLVDNQHIATCLIFHLRGEEEPYMAYIEIAPHNKGKVLQFDRVAG